MKFKSLSAHCRNQATLSGKKCEGGVFANHRRSPRGTPTGASSIMSMRAWASRDPSHRRTTSKQQKAQTSFRGVGFDRRSLLQDTPVASRVSYLASHRRAHATLGAHASPLTPQHGQTLLNLTLLTSPLSWRLFSLCQTTAWMSVVHSRPSSVHAPMARIASSNANVRKRCGNTPAIAKGTRTKGTNTNLSMTEEATNCRAPERPPKM
jgi:hypothetical protein